MVRWTTVASHLPRNCPDSHFGFPWVVCSWEEDPSFWEIHLFPRGKVATDFDSGNDSLARVRSLVLMLTRPGVEWMRRERRSMQSIAAG